MSLKLKQIVVSIENEPGRLSEVTESLGNAGINLRALNLVDTGLWPAEAACFRRGNSSQNSDEDADSSLCK